MLKQTDPNIKTIRFPITADSKLQKMAEKCGLTKLDFFIAMVDYFYKSKKDPRDLNDELLKKELVKRTDTIVGFIKTTDKELLRPLINSSERISQSQQRIVGYFNEHVLNHNTEQRTAYANQESTLKSVKDSIQKIEKAQLEKFELKARFSKILEYYIKQREAMGMLSNQGEKAALKDNARQQLKNL